MSVSASYRASKFFEMAIYDEKLEIEIEIQWETVQLAARMGRSCAYIEGNSSLNWCEHVT